MVGGFLGLDGEKMVTHLGNWSPRLGESDEAAPSGLHHRGRHANPIFSATRRAASNLWPGHLSKRGSISYGVLGEGTLS